MGSVVRDIRLALLLEDRVVREGLSWLLAGAGMRICVEAGSVNELLASLDHLDCDVVVIDLDSDLCAPSALDALGILRARGPNLRFLALTRSRAPALDAVCCREGAHGVLRTRDVGFADLVDAVQRVARGEQLIDRDNRPANGPVHAGELTRREREVLSFVGTGADNLKIAAMLNITEHTVKAHVGSLYRKLGSENRAELALLAVQLGFRPREYV